MVTFTMSVVDGAWRNMLSTGSLLIGSNMVLAGIPALARPSFTAV